MLSERVTKRVGDAVGKPSPRGGKGGAEARATTAEEDALRKFDAVVQATLM